MNESRSRRNSFPNCIADNYDAFLIDLDGVMYLDGSPIEGSVPSVKRLERRGKEIRFITNDPRYTRSTFVERLRAIGLSPTSDQIITSASATANYVSQTDIETVDVIGSSGLKTEIKRVGATLTQTNPDAVILGVDEETGYRDLQRACRHIHHGAVFLGTNPDTSFPTPEGPAPGAGAFIKTVQLVVRTAPEIVGKPNQRMFDMALETLETSRDRTIVIGDNPDTDILGANRAGLPGVLMQARSSPGKTQEPDDDRKPLGRIHSLTELFAD